MKVCSKCKEEKDLLLFSKNRANKNGYQSQCKACCNIAKAIYQQVNKVSLAAKKKIYYQANKVRLNAKNKEWQQNNPEKFKLIQAKWQRNNRDKCTLRNIKWKKKNPERYRLLGAKWKAANKDKVCAYRGKRRAAKLNATPAWADHKAIQSWYTLAKMFDKTFGEKHHVDHIVPLQGKDICGLHVEYNLQVLTATENIRKGNRYAA